MKLAAKFFLLVGVLVFGILWGINTAEKGIQRVEGASDQPSKGFHITKVDNGRLEVEVLGKQISSDSKLLNGGISGDGISLVATEVRSWVVNAARSSMEWIKGRF
ncbi:DUF3679 domain-containing protein [Aneurinibacillus tyrosinisolvens]|uniref:DUF3679 domain-containing protein n=1 Tax=Aneurinibacillus tyrosinisolvens TaxID=1443435 RepID=UPI00069C1AE8|nr:DUF3679 domain-containing protein [Aneurinibacillus tyrosinisolvens]